MSKVDLSVGLSTAQQAALVGHCFLNEEFFLKCKNLIKPEWLSGDLQVAHTFKELIKFYEKYKMPPKSGPELMEEAFFRSQKPQDFTSYQNTIGLCMQYSQSFTLDILRGKIADFIRTTKVLEQAKGLVIDVNKNNYASVVEKAAEIPRIWNEVDFDSSPYVDFSDVISLWTKENDVKDNFISTGSNTLDELLVNGLKRGGNLAVIAPTFTGKSRFLITLARHAMVQDKKVLYIIHEDDPENVKKRMISSITGMGIKEIESIMRGDLKEKSQLPKSWVPETWSDADRLELQNVMTNELTRAKALVDRNLVFLSWQKAGKMFVEDLCEEIKRIEMEQKNKTGRGIDMIVDDYPKHLNTKTRHENDRSRLEYVYNYLNTLARELNIFIAYAVQANRSSAKEMKNGKADQAIGLEDVGESYGIGQNAMSSVSLNRSKEDSDVGILRISVPKARDSGMNNMMLTRSAYNECVLYGDSRMFTTYGQCLIKGLVAIPSSQTISTTGAAHENLNQAEAQIDLSQSVEISKVPTVIKKIKGLPIIT